MMNKRQLKKSINAVCDEIFAEAIAISLYGNKRNPENDDALIRSVLMLRANYVSRISHPEPGMDVQAYYKDLREKFIAEAQEIVDQLNA
jgi:hypothetical protein